MYHVRMSKSDSRIGLSNAPSVLLVGCLKSFVQLNLLVVTRKGCGQNCQIFFIAETKNHACLILSMAVSVTLKSTL